MRLDLPGLCVIRHADYFQVALFGPPPRFHWPASSVSNMLCSSMVPFIRILLRRNICLLLSLFSSVCSLDCAA